MMFIGLNNFEIIFCFMMNFSVCEFVGFLYVYVIGWFKNVVRCFCGVFFFVIVVGCGFFKCVYLCMIIGFFVGIEFKVNSVMIVEVFV